MLGRGFSLSGDPMGLSEGLPLTIPAFLCSRSHRRGENQGREARSQRVRKGKNCLSSRWHWSTSPFVLAHQEGQLVQLTKASFRDQSVVSAVLGRARKPQPSVVTWAARGLRKSLYPSFFQGL